MYMYTRVLRLFLTLVFADIMCLHGSLGGTFTDLRGHRTFNEIAVSNVTETFVRAPEGSVDRVEPLAG